mgnify:CR=1 FL=1
MGAQWGEHVAHVSVHASVALCIMAQSRWIYALCHGCGEQRLLEVVHSGSWQIAVCGRLYVCDLEAQNRTMRPSLYDL